MVNKRTQEIFGRKPLEIIQRKHMYFTVIVVILAFGVFLYTLSQDGLQAPTITTRATIPTATEQAGGSQPSQDATAETIPKEDPEKKFYQYGGKCAVDVKKALDDVNDVNNYLSEYQDQHNTLQEEYNTLITDLDEEYLPELKRLQQEIGEAEEDLTYVESKLEDVREICEP